jgi:phage tail-like protein
MKLPRAPQAGLQLRSRQAWQRCAFEDCALIDDGVELMWMPWPAAAPIAEPLPATITLGLCFDRLGRASRSVAGGGLESLPLAEQAQGLSLQPPPRWTPLPATPHEGCGPGEAVDGPTQPGALAAAAPDLLWVADADKVWRYDIWGRRYRGAVAQPATVVALQTLGDDAVLALGRAVDGTGGLQLLRACSPPRALPWPAGLRDPGGLALDGRGQAWVLLRAGTATAEIVALGAPAQPQPGLRIAVPGARAIAIGDALRDSPGARTAVAQRLFVARAPGQRWRLFSLDGAEDRENTAPGYDGGAIAAAPDGRVAYVAIAQGLPELRYAAPTRLARAQRGRVLSFRLDAEQPRARWGRLMLEACLAPNTHIVVRCLASDDDAPALDEAARTPPANQPGLQSEAHSPPLPDVLDVEALHALPARACVAALPSGQRGGLAGWRAARDGHLWLESWCGVEGRFLWVEIELQGDGQRSPVLRAVEIEQPGHDWLQQLPALFSREAAAADFLRRYLAAPANLLADLGLEAEQRHRLLSAEHSPPAMLDWLAGLIGLALRPAWSERARRQLLVEAPAMAARHGTPEVLRRLVEILAGAPVLLIEAFRLRAPGVIGGHGDGGTAVLGAGIRLGAALLGEDQPETVEDEAWRFTLLIQAPADEELLAMLRDAVERFKPAHTAFTLCALDSGLRVGRGLHLDLAALIGPDSGLPVPVLGSTRLGRDALLGRSSGEAGEARC